MDLRQIVLWAAERHPHRIAIADSRGRLTYQRWVEDILSLAKGFADHGITMGDRVAIGMRNSTEAATVFFATQVLGAVAVPFNFRSKPVGIAQVLEDSQASAVVCDAGVAPDEVFQVSGVPERILRVAATANPSPGWIPLNHLMNGGRPTLKGATLDDKLSTILYTSGTTGRPKGVPLTHKNTYARITSYISTAGPTIDAEIRALGAAPIYHTVGLHWVLCLTAYVNGTYYPISDASQSAMLETIFNDELTYVFGSPTLFHIMLSGRPPMYENLPSVRQVTFGSAPMSTPMFDDMKRCFSNATINEVYGTTELSIPLLTHDSPKYPNGALHVTADQHVRIVNPGGTPNDLVREGEPGELIVDINADANVTSYWNAPDKWAAKVRAGWFYTGDCFRRDSAGNYFISGRLDDLIITGGENVQPAEVEQILLEHPDIVDAAVVGTPHETWGEVVTAFVVRSDPTFDEATLEIHCRQSALADFKRPRRVTFVDSIPRNPSGKIVRAEVRALYATNEVV